MKWIAYHVSHSAMVYSWRNGVISVDIHVLLFAAAAEAAGRSELQLTFGDDGQAVTVADARDQMLSQVPTLATVLGRCWFAVNDEYTTVDAVLVQGDELAVIPPVSGGILETPEVAIMQAPLTVEAMYEQLVTPEAGAVLIFSGTVREFTRGRQTERLQYEAYDAMALRKMQELVDDCKARFPILRMVIWHRTGTLSLTETSVLIGVCTPHRKAAFAAGEYAIETLKRTVPIWKKEWFVDGGTEWVGPDGPWDPR